MPPLQLRQEFPTLKAFKEALHAWAIEAHFEPRILKSDTGRVRVGCKRDPNCPFVIRCNWERKNGREPLARVTVLRERHTCLNGWVEPAMNSNIGQGNVPTANMMGLPSGNGMQMGMNGMMGSNMSMMNANGQVEIRSDNDGNILGGARVLGPIERSGSEGQVVAVLPKVQRNSASRLPFLMDMLPRLMDIQKETTPMEIRETLLREVGQEVHLQQCRRAKTEILKKREQGEDAQGQPKFENDAHGEHHSLDGLGSDNANDGQQNNMFADMNTPNTLGSTPNMNTHSLPSTNHSLPSNGHSIPTSNNNANSHNSNSHNNGMNGQNNNVAATSQPSPHPHPFTLHTAAGVVTPVVQNRGSAALREVGEQPIKCPYCINHRWMKSIQDAVEHMSMHVTV